MNQFTRIEEAAQSAGLSITDVCREAGISRSTLTELKTGRTKSLSAQKLSAISRALNVPVAFLTAAPPFDCWDLINANRKGFLYYIDVSGESLDMFWGIDSRDPDTATLQNFTAFVSEAVAEATPTSEGDWNIKLTPLMNGKGQTDPKNIRPVATQRLPILGNIACGEPIFADEDRESYVEVGTELRADFCLRAVGDSMINARILDGDVVFIRQQPTVNNGEIAAVLIGDEATLKRVYYYPEKKKLVLNPENPKHEPLVYVGEELEEIRVLGKAVAFQSNVI
jgi:SOS regulatory protein LexA